MWIKVADSDRRRALSRLPALQAGPFGLSGNLE